MSRTATKSELVMQANITQRIAKNLAHPLVRARRPAISQAQSMDYAIQAFGNPAINATLRKDEWEIVDARVNIEARDPLNVFEQFRSRNLVETIGIGDIERVSEFLSGFTEASVTFDGEASFEVDRADYGNDRRSIPIISHGFKYGFRQMASSEKRGNNLQTDSAGLAGRSVGTRVRDLITNGLATGGPSGGGIPGLTTAPLAIDVSLGTAWDESGATIVDDVLEMIQAAIDGFFFGPYILWVPKNYWTTLANDYSTQKGDRTFLERILAIPGIDDVIMNASLDDDNVILQQATKDVMDLSLALPMTTWQWQKNPTATQFRVLTLMGPHIKTVMGEDGTARNGIVHLS